MIAPRLSAAHHESAEKKDLTLFIYLFPFKKDRIIIWLQTHVARKFNLISDILTSGVKNTIQAGSDCRKIEVPCC